MNLAQEEVEKAMAAGAFGISTGLILPPGCYSFIEELMELTRVVGDKGGLYFSHIRSEDETLIESIGEVIKIGHETSASVHISHFKAAGKENWNKSAQALDIIENTRVLGKKVTADMYPYLASCTTIGVLLPDWAHEGGIEATLKRLRANMMSEEWTKEKD